MRAGKKRVKKSGRSLHTVRQRIGYAEPPRTRLVVCLMILLMFGLVGVTVLATLSNTPERMTERRVAEFVADYYENYLHPTLEVDDPGMTRYVEHGFAPITLRQLLLYDNQKNSEYADELTQYCDENSTLVWIFPYEPYGKKDYRVEYKWGCNF